MQSLGAVARHCIAHLHICACLTRKLELQGMSGCQQMQWRNQTGGYLREILTAKVYDVAVRAWPLHDPLGTTLLLYTCFDNAALRSWVHY